MKIQNLAIIFIIIILPISIVLATYTQYQIQTINTQTLYDNKLASATYDAIRAFQINTSDNQLSELANSKTRDLEGSISTFRNSIMSTFSLDGYSEEDLNSYIPALVYTLYDGFYIYSPYKNENYRYDENGNKKDENGQNVYGLKPYISYSCRYVKENIDVVITYALDNHITVQGMLNGEYVNKEGYLIDNIEYRKSGDRVFYNGVEIIKESTKEYLPLQNQGGTLYDYVKLEGKTYYFDENNKKIIALLNENTLTDQYKDGDAEYYNAMRFIKNGNTLAKDYYIDAYKFTSWFKSTNLVDLTYGDVQDTVVTNDGDIRSQENVWKNNNTKIFQFNQSNTDYSKNIENELSSFNQHRLAVIRHKIEVNLAIAIANYNNYSNAASNNVFQMPDLKEEEWYNIIHNVSLISFLQGLPIGGKIYNGYSIVNNSESKEVVLEQNIYIMGRDKTMNKYEYYKIGDQGIKNGTVEISAGLYTGDASNIFISAGRLNLSFMRKVLTTNYKKYYYYPIQGYNASYNSIIMQNNVDTYDDIYTYVNSQGGKLKVAFYTALGRERAGLYKSWSDYISDDGYTVILDPSGGSVSTTGLNVKYGYEYGPLPIPIKKGYSFTCWKTEDGKIINENSIKNTNEKVKLIAQWSKNRIGGIKDTEENTKLMLGTNPSGSSATYGYANINIYTVSVENDKGYQIKLNASNNTGSGYDGNAKVWKNLLGNNNGILHNAIWKKDYLYFNGNNSYVEFEDVGFVNKAILKAEISVNAIQNDEVDIVGNFQRGGVGLWLKDGYPAFDVYPVDPENKNRYKDYISVKSPTKLPINKKVSIEGGFDGNNMYLKIDGKIVAQK